MKERKEKLIVLGSILVWFAFYCLVIIIDKDTSFMPWLDVGGYRQMAEDIFVGKIPYRDITFEYPPASVLAFVLPGLFALDYDPYIVYFSMQNMLLGIFTTLVAYGIKRLLGIRSLMFTIIQTICLLILFPVFFARYDILPAFLTAFGVYMYLLGVEKEKGVFKTIAYSVIMLAGLVKLYPFFILPMLVVLEFKRKEYKLLFRNLIMCGVTMLPAAVLMWMGREGVAWFLNYHAERGLQIESLYSTIALFLSQLNIINGVEVVYTHLSHGLGGDVPRFFANISFPLFFILYFLLLVVLFLQNWKKGVSEKIVFGSAGIILLFVALNKVLSPQYIIWLFPFILLAIYKCLKGFERRVAIIGVGVICLFTIMVFPIFYTTFVKGNIYLTFILLLRNLLLVAFTIFPLKYLVEKARSKE